MHLWVGLGNPGDKYLKTRHNVGAIILQQLSRECDYKFDKSLNSLIGKNSASDIKLIYLIPQTFMNLSGDAVIKALRSFKILPANMVVFHDEIELPPQKVSYKFGGGHRGHNGLRDIIQKIGTADFHRVRIGVGRPDNEYISVADYVLSNIPQKDIPDINEVEMLLRKENLI
ncbi:MAG: aminoacyl-tRNA hydrolase [Spirochaetia bacterium]|nr:aminoacyl-tRNA hydrolase [Spirochaetia bacterium]